MKKLAKMSPEEWAEAESGKYHTRTAKPVIRQERLPPEPTCLQWVCLRKFRFPDEGAARVESWRKGLFDIEVYKCMFCDGWHMGHSNRQDKKR